MKDKTDMNPNILSDDTFENRVLELISERFNSDLDSTQERKPKADKGV